MSSLHREKHFQILGYGTFFDFPRGLFAYMEQRVVYLECEFSDELDDFRDYFDVYVVIGATKDDLYTGAFYHKSYKRIYLGKTGVQDIDFDISKRKYIASKALLSLVQNYQPG